MACSREDREAQEDELLALANIYTSDEFWRVPGAQGGQITTCFNLPQGFTIFVSGEKAASPLKGHFEVCFLPPVVLAFELPADYPSASPPLFELSCRWLSPMQLSSLRKRLHSLWEEHKARVVLFAWMQFLKEDALQHLNILSPYEVKVNSRDLQCHNHVTEDTEQQLIPRGEEIAESELLEERSTKDAESLDSLIRDILDFDQTQQLRSFQAKAYLCNICFSERLGIECTRFKVCQHVYCNDCLRGYFEIQIKEGQVHLLHCPEPKCGSLSTPAQVKELVGEELFARYDRLLLQSSLNSMSDVVYCPSLNCETPVVKEPGGKMGICTECRFPFCTLCNKTYHGITPCAQPEVDDEDENQPSKKYRRQMPLTHKELRRLKKENLYKKFVKRNCKKCPHCGVEIEKNGGCRSMGCINCRKCFCWECTRPFESETLPICSCSQ